MLSVVYKKIPVGAKLLTGIVVRKAKLKNGVCSLLSNMLLVFCAKFPDMQGKYRENVNFSGFLSHFVPHFPYTTYINSLKIKQGINRKFSQKFLLPTLFSGIYNCGCPGMPKDLSVGDTARQIVSSVRRVSSITKLVVKGLSSLWTYSTEA